MYEWNWKIIDSTPTSYENLLNFNPDISYVIW